MTVILMPLNVTLFIGIGSQDISHFKNTNIIEIFIKFETASNILKCDFKHPFVYVTCSEIYSIMIFSI